MKCSHGTNIEVEPCYWCDIYDRPSEPTIDDLCAAGGHAYYKEDRRCYCGYRDDRAAPPPAEGETK